MKLSKDQDHFGDGTVVTAWAPGMFVDAKLEKGLGGIIIRIPGKAYRSKPAHDETYYWFKNPASYRKNGVD